MMKLDGIIDVAKPVNGEQNEHLDVSGNITVHDLEVTVTTNKDVGGEVAETKHVLGNIAGNDGGDLSEITVISGAEDSVQLPAAGFYGIGKVTVKGDENLAPENIKKGKTIFGVDGDYAPEPPKLTERSAEITRNGTYTYDPPEGFIGLRKVKVKVDVPTEVIEEVVDAVFQSKTVTPSAKAQNITPDEEDGFNALSSVYVEGDSDLKSENIVKGKTIFGVDGSYEKRELQSKTVTPKADGRTVKPDADFEGLSSVYVEGDSDLIPANIRKGANIFGVDGSYSTGMNYQDKTIRPTGKQINVSADEGFDALAKVTIEGDSNLAPSNIAKGKTIYGVMGDYVSPMIEVQNIVPSTDPQFIIPPDGFHGFKSITVEAMGGGGGDKPTKAIAGIYNVDYLLPPMPELPHPYAFIYYVSGIFGIGSYYYLINTTTLGTIGETSHYFGENVVAYRVTGTNPEESAWETYTPTTTYANHSALRWSNFNIYSTADELVMKNGTYVPVYEIRTVFDGEVAGAYQESGVPASPAYKFEGVSLTAMDCKYITVFPAEYHYLGIGNKGSESLHSIDGGMGLAMFYFYFDEHGVPWACFYDEDPHPIKIQKCIT